MSDFVTDAAQVLVPLAAMGAGAVVQEASKEAGKDFYGAARSILVRVRGLLRRRDPDVSELGEALRAALEQQLITEQDLRLLVQLHRSSHDAVEINVSGDVKNNFVNGNFIGPNTFN